MSRRTRRRRAEASYGPEVGTTYLLHFIDPATGEAARYKHAGHYIGWTRDLAARLDAHARGTGARLVEVITRAGLGFSLARTWPQTTRDREDLLKHIGDARRFCPMCGVTPAAARLASDLAAARRAPERTSKPQVVPEYDFEDWPDLTARHTAAEAAALTDCLQRGRRAAYKAAEEAGARAGLSEEYATAFDTALEVDVAWQKSARETLLFHGREPDESVDEWISRIRQEAPRQQQEDEVFGRRARQARRQREAAERQQDAQADRLFALADELDRRAGERPDYRREITAERAARIRRELGEALASQAAAQAAEPAFQGAELDAELGRLAEMFQEPQPSAEGAPDYYRSPAGSAGHQAAYAQMHAAADGTGFADPDPGLSYEIDNVGELARERYHDELAERHYREVYGDIEAEEQADREYEDQAEAEQAELGPDASRWSPEMDTPAPPAHFEPSSAQAEGAKVLGGIAEYDRLRAPGRYDQAVVGYEAGAPDHLYGAPDCAEADPETAHFGTSSPEAQDAGRWPLPRVLEPGEVSGIRAPVAATLPDGTPHADPFLARRGWQAQDGLYVRQPQAQLEAG